MLWFVAAGLLLATRVAAQQASADNVMGGGVRIDRAPVPTGEGPTDAPATAAGNADLANAFLPLASTAAQAANVASPGMATVATVTTVKGVTWTGDFGTGCTWREKSIGTNMTTAEGCRVACAYWTNCTHYSWNATFGGTCFLFRKAGITQGASIPTTTKGAICGIGVDWQGQMFASGCDFPGNDLSSAKTTRAICAMRCKDASGCTHYTWKSVAGGTCFLKTNRVTKAMAITTTDRSALCGIKPVRRVGDGGDGFEKRIYLLGEEFTTAWNDNGKTNVFFLDRHNVICPASEALMRFVLRTSNTGTISFAYMCDAPVPITTDTVKLNTDYTTAATFMDLSPLNVMCPEDRPALQQWYLNGDGQQARISYTCAGVVSTPRCVTQTTSMNDDGGGQLIFLDRHNVQCGMGEFLSSWKINIGTSKNFQFTYSCCTTDQRRFTPWNENGDTDMFFFDRHDVACPAPTALSHFQLETRPAKMRFAYTCEAHVPVTTDTVTLNTNDVTSKTFMDLSSTNVVCPTDRPALRQWRLGRNGQGPQARITYTCAQVLGTTSGCVARSTGMNDDGRGALVFWDRHSVRCEAGEFMSSWKINKGSSNLFQFTYTCCKAKPCAPAPPGYTFYPNKDSPNGDIRQFPDLADNMAGLAEKCNADSSCMGFNTNGWLKSQVQPVLEPWGPLDKCQGFYVGVCAWVTCSASTNACTNAACDRKTGRCATTNKPNGPATGCAGTCNSGACTSCSPGLAAFPGVCGSNGGAAAESICGIPAATTPQSTCTSLPYGDPPGAASNVKMKLKADSSISMFSGSTSITARLAQALAGGCTPLVTGQAVDDMVAVFSSDSPKTGFARYMADYVGLLGSGAAADVMDQLADACGGLPLTTEDSKRSFLVLPMPFQFRGEWNAICSALRPCQAAGHEYMFGFAGKGLEFGLEVGAYEMSVSPSYLAYRHNGNGLATSKGELWVLSNNVMGEMASVTTRTHVQLEGKVDFAWSPVGSTDLLKIGMSFTAMLGVDLDPLNNGMGGSDHAVMISAEGSPYIEAFYGTLVIDQMAKRNADIFWKYTSNFNLQVGLTSSMSLKDLFNSIKIKLGKTVIPVGGLIATLMPVDVTFQAGSMVTVNPGEWGVKLFARGGVGKIVAAAAPTIAAPSNAGNDTETESIPLHSSIVAALFGVHPSLLGDGPLAQANTSRAKASGAEAGAAAAPPRSGAGAPLTRVLVTGVVPDLLISWGAMEAQVVAQAAAAAAASSADPDQWVALMPATINGVSVAAVNAAGFSASTGIVVRKKSATGVRIGLDFSGTIVEFMTCPCESDSFCLAGLLCIKKKSGGGFCFTDSYCLSGDCKMDYIIFGYCSDCRNNRAVCGSGEFCDGYRCRTKLGGGEPGCKNNWQCFSGWCAGGTCAANTACTSDAGCSAEAEYCSAGRRCTFKQFFDGGCSANNQCRNGLKCISGKCKDCASDDDCQVGFCNEHGSCKPGLPVNAPCSINADCRNDACGRSTAEDDASKICCPSNRVAPFGGFDYCKEMRDGSVCWSNEQCATGWCRNGWVGWAKGICGKLEVGQQGCDVDADCRNNACGRPTAAEDAKKECCRSGAVRRWTNSLDYCTELPVGTRCNADGECAGVKPGQSSGGCGRPNADSGTKVCCSSGAVRRWTDSFDYCTELPVGTRCNADGECAGVKPGQSSGGCGRPNADSGTKICCPSGAVRRWTDSLDYCTELPVGTRCNADGECAGVKPGQSSGGCGRPNADTDTKICCPSGAVRRWWANSKDYCTQMPLGTKCHTDDECASGYCKEGRCTDRVDRGARCERDADCKNNQCARRSAASYDDNNKICCPSDRDGMYLGSWYCYGLPVGYECKTNAMCENRACGRERGTNTLTCCGSGRIWTRWFNDYCYG